MIFRPTSYTLEIDDLTLKKLRAFYGGFEKEIPNPYVLCSFRPEKAAITVYKPKKKGVYRVLFQGPDSFDEARIWKPDLEKEEAKVTQPQAPRILLPRLANFYPQIGSDETGTGNFFGPVEVAAAYVRREDVSFLQELGITDSKLMTDEKILEVTPLLLKRLPYCHLSLSAERYNDVHDENNANAIKAKMHNACLLKLKQKYPDSSVYQDQFAEARLYYSYLKSEKDVVRGIVFATKGESKFPSVAAGSVIARYSLLRKMEALDAEYGVHFPFGAGEDVDRFTLEFADRFGLEALQKVAKISFRNYGSLLEKRMKS